MTDKLKYRVYSKEHRKFLTENDCVVQRSTERFDKNGKLIYEGDVLWTDIENDFMRVHWDNGAYKVGSKDVAQYDLSELPSDEIEVRGNVFEGWTSPYQDVPLREGWTRYENRKGVSDE